jgi:choline dehydrogenase
MNADYVIVGAGSAGCAMAYRLAEAGKSVLVIEAGGTDIGPFIQMPGALSYPMNMKRYDWGYVSEPEPHLSGRRMACPRGRVIGGSSSINGMVYVRGHAQDYEAWQELGADGWSYADVYPYFERMESWHPGPHGGDPSWRGTDGPLHVSRGKRDNPLVQAFVKAGVEAGYPETDDYNGEQQEGFGPMEATIFQGRRWSAAHAYLRPALLHDHCNLVRAEVQSIVIKDGRATGVKVTMGSSPKGEIKEITANSEVILAASAINSPKILMLSGIGPADHLTEHGIPVVADRPGVGQNLQDHLELYVQYAVSKPVSLYKYWNVFGKAWVGLLWLLSKTGPGASNQFESTGFIRSAAGVPYPDLQYHFLPIAVRYDGSISAAGHGMQAHVGPMRSPSRGAVCLASANPQDAPKITFNYMSVEKDWVDFRAAIRLTREIFAQSAFDDLRARELIPGAEIQSDDDLNDVIREHAESAYHPCGTCRMGAADDPNAVVDPEGRVIGVQGLRVADSSIFPQITNGNINGPSIMVGEKIADHVLGKRLAPAQNRSPWQNPNWQTSQR